VQVGSTINAGMGIMDMCDTGTHIILVSWGGDYNRYNKSTGTLETEVDDNKSRRGCAWRDPFIYCGFSTSGNRDDIEVASDQSTKLIYNGIVSNASNGRKGLAYDYEDDLFYLCFDNTGSTIFSASNSSSNVNSVTFTNEGSLGSWTDRGNLYSFDILRCSAGKFIIGKDSTNDRIWALYKISN